MVIVFYYKMPQITITLDSNENKEIEIFKAKEGLKSKAEAVTLALRKYFNIKQAKKR